MNYYDKEVLSDQTKEILEYFFLEQTKDVIENSSRKEKKLGSRKAFEKLLTQKQKYIDRVWDENHTIVNYLLVHKDFKLSHTRLNELSKITNDWSSPNNQGENALFFLIKKKYELNQILDIIDKIQINSHQKNAENHYFVNYFLNIESIEEVLQQFEKGVNNFPEIKLNKYFNNYINLLQQFKDLFQDSIIIEKEKFKKIKHRLQSYDFKMFNTNQIGVKLEDTLEKVEKHLNYLLLSDKLKEKHIKAKPQKI